MSDNHKIVQASEVAIVDTSQNQLHPLILALCKGDIDTETREKVMDLQERHEKREAKKAYDAAMRDLKQELPTFIEQDKLVTYAGKNNKPVSFTHTTLALLADSTIPHLTRFGFSHSWIPNNDEKMVYVKCRITHKDGHSEECSLQSPPDLSGGKSTSQGIASTITRLERYSFAALVGVATKDMRETDPRQTDHDNVDPSKNLQAVATLQSVGITLEQAQQHVDSRDVREWTEDDLAKLREWYNQRKHKAHNAPLQPEHPPAPAEMSAKKQALISAAEQFYGEGVAMNEISRMCRALKTSFNVANDEQCQIMINQVNLDADKDALG